MSPLLCNVLLYIVLGYVAVLGLGLTASLFPLTLFLHTRLDVATGQPLPLPSAAAPAFLVARGSFGDADTLLWLRLTRAGSPGEQGAETNVSLALAGELDHGVIVPASDDPLCRLPPGLHTASFFYDGGGVSQSPLVRSCSGNILAAGSRSPAAAALPPRHLHAAWLYLDVSPLLHTWASEHAWLHYLGVALGTVLYAAVCAVLARPSTRNRLAALPTASAVATFRSAALSLQVAAALFAVFLVLAVATALRDVIDVAPLSFFLYMLYLAAALCPVVIGSLLGLALHASQSPARIAPAPSTVDGGESGSSAASYHSAAAARAVRVAPPPFDVGSEGADDPTPDAPFYCPLCMLHYPRIYATSCCSHSTCAACANEYFERPPASALDPAALGPSAPHVPCPFCARTDGWTYARVEGDAGAARRYADTPFKVRGREAEVLAAQSPLRIGAGVDDMRRKMVSYDAIHAPRASSSSSSASLPPPPPLPPPIAAHHSYSSDDALVSSRRSAPPGVDESHPRLSPSPAAPSSPSSPSSSAPSSPSSRLSTASAPPTPRLSAASPPLFPVSPHP